MSHHTITSAAHHVTLDGNEAAAAVAYAASEVVAIYPITPASAMGEHADAWAAAGRQNVFGMVPRVIEMQSEGGAAGAIHGSLQAGSMTTTFTASQGLLLMMPNMFKIAGELTPAVFHIAARSIATHALSIFGDHSDVMALRATGWGMLCSGGVQESGDMAAIAHAATLRTRLPFMHFFDGFRTSHEINTVEAVPSEIVAQMLDERARADFRQRALDPDAPTLRGSAQNPDVFFQAREAANRYYDDAPQLVQEEMDRFGALTGRRYNLFDYRGHPEADRVIVVLGSAGDAADRAADWLAQRGEKVGVVHVRLYRPFDIDAFVAALPASVRHMAVLDRCKEPGATGEPLYQDVVVALDRAWPGERVRVIGGRYGLSSKEFTPAMAGAVFDELTEREVRPHFTVGINDDVTRLSLDHDHILIDEPEDEVRAVFFGLGSDGTVGANKNSVKIIADETDRFAQGYFVYDSKKSGSVTVSHLRFGPRPIRASWLIDRATFVACHRFDLLDKRSVLDVADQGATVLINAPVGPNELWAQLSAESQEQALEKNLTLYCIDANAVASSCGLKNRINTIMQTCFFELAGVMPVEQAIAAIKAAIEKSYSKRGPEIVEQNKRAVDAAIAALHKVEVPDRVTAARRHHETVPPEAPDFVHRVVGQIIAGRGDMLPVSALPVDGVFPTGTAKYEKRSIALELPIWEPDLCTQCGLCSLVCPHSAIRVKSFAPHLANGGSPEGFRAARGKGKDFADRSVTVQLAPDDCTGCTACVQVCPAVDKEDRTRKAINMAPKDEHIDRERTNWDYFLSIPASDRRTIRLNTIKGSQLAEPLFEFSGACSGCGETPYLKLLTQLFGDRMLVANATGCSSIFGGNLPTTPWTCDAEGRGPAWANSLFEDNAEFGLGMRLGSEQRAARARALVHQLAGEIGFELAEALLNAPTNTESAIAAQRSRVALLRERIDTAHSPTARELHDLADALVDRSVWIIGGDGWAYDIGFGGLDHVLASGADVNILVLDTEVYSNTGGQASKATPRAAVAKFAAAGKSAKKKDLGMLAVSYGSVYVAQIAIGANPQQTIRAMTEAESYAGPSLIIAYSHCIAHGIDTASGNDHQKQAVQVGYWPLYRYDPRLEAEGKVAMKLDSRRPGGGFRQFAEGEGRFASLLRADADRGDALLRQAESDIAERWSFYERLAGTA
ncbi:MAG: pyruvate:ferredoxin (flavodoxin) oxidoreductase [Planctomycetota bacterium]